jgi:hypothetical protein
LLQQLPNYDSYQAGVSANYIFRPHIFIFLGADVRRFTVAAGQATLGQSAMFGLMFSPSRLPLPAW